MPTREVLVCSKCGAVIEEDPMLGDRQGGRINIQLGANTMRLILCPKHLEPLMELEQYAEDIVPGGTAVGAEVLKYLPRIEKEDGATVAPPTFSESTEGRSPGHRSTASPMSSGEG